MRYTTDRSGTAPATPGLSTDGTEQSERQRTGRAASAASPGWPAGLLAPSSPPPSLRAGQRVVEVPAEFLVGTVGRGGEGPHDEPGPLGEAGHPVADQVTQPALDLIADHSSADGPRHDEAGTRRQLLCTRRLVKAENEVHDHGSSTGAPTRPDGLGEVHPPPQTLRGRQHGQSRALASGQADKRSRPLDRRAEIMARPARVRIRSRKPWVFARRRLFG